MTAVRILVVTTAFPLNSSDPRGAHIERMVSGLRRDGHDVDVVAPVAEASSGATPGFRSFAFWPVRARLIDGVAGIVPNLRARPWLVFQVPALVTAMLMAVVRAPGRFDVIHAQWILPTGAVSLVASRLRRRGEPVVMTAHGGDVNPARSSRVWRWVLGAVARRANVCTAVSRDLRGILLGLGVPSERLLLTPLGVELEDVPKDDQARSGFLFVGSLIPRKGVATLVRAWDKAGVDARLRIVGDGPERDALERVSTELGLGVEFCGAQPKADTLQYMATSECLVLPSLSEGRPVVIMEMLARGGTVLASAIPGSVELLGEDWPGLFNPGDVEGLAALIARFHGDPCFRKELRDAAVRVVNDSAVSLRESTREFAKAYEVARRCQ